MSKILYFGNLPFITTAADLTKLVKPFGEVISTGIGLDKKTYKSRGFGFVEVPDNAARVVIETLHGARFHGRELKVNESTPHPTRKESPGRTKIGWSTKRYSRIRSPFPILHRRCTFHFVKWILVVGQAFSLTHFKCLTRWVENPPNKNLRKRSIL